ncbi:ribonuclease D [Acaryochloris marina]|uniref:Ribonuclease D n=1 Tax=Acaryochloris marina (strain MBIC 11017) TaxID=329726 RepID=B0CB58_ACAM1|nr:ribonuclease H-like domain-containing protein [Acaryochloris marina]ABW26697.1 ribonuclease D [Acaryochloris marina MBIC11017]BDM81481.1 ribonuclease D [Acaryochloris marina MBIC10699]
MALSEFQVCDRDLSDAFLQDYLQADRIAVDTETMGLKPHRDRLCLVQICNPEGQVTVVRIAQGQMDAPNLKQLMESDTVLKVFHFARFDIATLLHHLDIETMPIFCTKIASKLVRTYSPRHGLKELVRELVGEELDKSAQSSDWGNAENLSEEQLNYASNDVRYLLSAQATLVKMLEREERLELAMACFQCLPTIVTLDLMHFDNIFEH